MAILPFEQITQRRDACVAAPGVILWSSTTDLATREVLNTDLVTEGEVEDAQMAPDTFFWDVVIGDVLGEYDSEGFGDGPFGDEAFGAPTVSRQDAVYQDRDSIDDEWFIADGLQYWGEGFDEDGVYP